MGNNKSKIEEKARDIEGAVAGLNRINEVLATYRIRVYNSEFNEKLPNPNDPDLIFTKRYSNMSYQKDIDRDGIKTHIQSVIEIPHVLASKRIGIINAVTDLVELIVGNAEAFVFSKAYTWRITGDDGREYLYTAAIVATAIETKNWGIPEGVGFQAAITFVFRADGTSLNIPDNPKHDLQDPPAKKPLQEILL